MAGSNGDERMKYPPYEKKPTVKLKNDHRRCIWVNNKGVRCKQKATGWFFCKSHLSLATNIENGSMGSDQTSVRGGK